MRVFKLVFELNLKFGFKRTQGWKCSWCQNYRPRVKLLYFSETNSCIKTPKTKHTLSFYVWLFTLLFKGSLLKLALIFFFVDENIKVLSVLVFLLDLVCFWLFHVFCIFPQPHQLFKYVVPGLNTRLLLFFLHFPYIEQSIFKVPLNVDPITSQVTLDNFTFFWYVVKLGSIKENAENFSSW